MQTYIKENVQQWTNVGDHVSIIDSTNDELQRRIKKAAQSGQPVLEGTSVRCDFQSAGKGRMARTWVADPCQNLMVSYALDASSIGVEHLFAVSQNVSITVAQIVSGYLPKADVIVKWPNDIFIDHRKVAGILIETILSQERIGACIVGIGLNIGQVDFPSGSRGTSLRLEGSTVSGPEQVWKALTQALQQEHLRLKSDLGFIKEQTLRQNYESMLYGINEFAEYRDLKHESTFIGRLIGVTMTGEAKILSESQTRIFGMDDIKLMKLLDS